MIATKSPSPKLRSTLAVVVVASSFVAFLALLLGVALGAFTGTDGEPNDPDVEVRELGPDEFRRRVETALGDAESVTLAWSGLFPGDWDECHVFSPYSAPGERLRDRGVEDWSRLSSLRIVAEMHEGVELLTFVRTGSLREFVSTREMGVRFSGFDTDRGTVGPATRVMISRRVEEWGTFYELSPPRSD